jgi:hypothetical protein
MRKALRLLALVLSLTLLISVAQAAVKAGSACSKLGSTSTVSGKKYTCIKSGKKLVWNKGVLVAAPKPSSSPTATPTPSATTTPTPTPTPAPVVEDDSVVISKGITYRYINGVLERQAYLSSKFFTTDSRNASAFDPIRAKAYEEIRARVTNAAHPNLIFNWDVKAGFPTELANYSKDYVEAAASFWGWVFKEQVNVPAQLVTEQDLEWQKTQDVKFSDTVDILTLFTTANFKKQKAWMGGGAHYWFRDPSNPRVFALLNFQTPSYATTSNMNANWVMVPAHEVTHIIQDYYRKGIGESDMKSFDLRTNATFQEGTATLFGYAISMKNIGWYSDGLDEYLYGNFKYDNYWKPVKTVEDVVKVLEETEARTNNSTHQSSYPIGAMLYEWVIAKYGFDSYIRILENLPKNANYSDTIKTALGISKAELYQGAAPYILAAFTRLKL